MISNIQLGAKIKALCDERGVSVDGICSASGFDEETVNGWISGAKIVSYNNLVVLATILGTTVSDLLNPN